MGYRQRLSLHLHRDSVIKSCRRHPLRLGRFKIEKKHGSALTLYFLTFFSNLLESLLPILVMRLQRVTRVTACCWICCCMLVRAFLQLKALILIFRNTAIILSLGSISIFSHARATWACIEVRDPLEKQIWWSFSSFMMKISSHSGRVEAAMRKTSNDEWVLRPCRVLMATSQT